MRPRFLGLVDGDNARDPFQESVVPLAAEAPDGAWVWVRVQGGVGHPEPFAAPGSALAAMADLAARHGLDPVHPEPVEEEAAAWAADPGIDDPALADLTHLPLCTIDEEHSRDLDQALFVERDGPGFVVWYAIADAAWFVRPGTALFSEALRRGATFYLPGLVVPMLPRALSEDLVSLNPRVDRRALVFRVRLDRDGRVRDADLLRARVRSRVKTWYDAVQGFVDGAEPAPDPAVADSLRALVEVGERRLALRESRDVVTLRRSEVAVSLSGSAGHRFVAMADCRNQVERYNEQVSLLCNVEGARALLRHHPGGPVDPIFRVHEPPAPERLAELERVIAALVRVHRLGPSWRWDRAHQSLATYLDGLPADHRVARAIHRQALVSTAAASFTSVPGRHHGVGADVYARFTAPMREIVGVFVHGEAWELVSGAGNHDPALRDQVIEASNAARKAQRELDHQANHRVLDQLFADDLARNRDARPLRPGTVLGISRSKVHVQLDDPPIDVKVYKHHLQQQVSETLRQGRDRITLRRAGGKVECRVGDAVRVRVEGHDDERNRWALGLL